MATAFQAVWSLGEYQRRILLAYTNHLILRELREAFVRAGFDVVVATDVGMALRCLTTHSFDFCIVQYDLPDTRREARRTGEQVVNEFSANAQPSYRNAWVLITQAEHDMREFEDSRRDDTGPAPIVNILQERESSANGSSGFDHVANRLVDFVKNQLDFFWDLPLALEAATDEVRNALYSVNGLRDRPLQIGDMEPSPREMLGEALRLATSRTDTTNPIAARARLLSDQGHASTVVLLSPIDRDGLPFRWTTKPTPQASFSCCGS